jgi:hypothetical protein
MYGYTTQDEKGHFQKSCATSCQKVASQHKMCLFEKEEQNIQRGTHPGSGSRERLQPFAVPFMALFDRDQRRARSTLSRFLAALTEAPVAAVRTLFLDDLRETAHSRTTPMRSKPGVWWIEQETPGWSLISMAPVRQPA